MKIAILGYSGSGKSTLARKLGERYHCEVLHLDSIQFTDNWQERDREEARAMVADFMEKDAWIIEGNYQKFHQERRLREANRIIFLDFGRFTCLRRAYGRYRTYKGRSREDMAPGCNEKFDAEFIRWILWEGRTRAVRQHYRDIQVQYGDKMTVLHSQREMDRFLASLGE